MECKYCGGHVSFWGYMTSGGSCDDCESFHDDDDYDGE